MRLLSLKRSLLIGGAAALLAGAGALGVTYAQTATPTPNSTNPTPTPGAAPSGTPRAGRADAFLDALAKRLGVSTDKLRQAIQDARKDAGLPGAGGFGRPGGPGGPGGLGGPGARRPGPMPLMIMHDAADAAAKAIGISADQLRQELPGKSLADVAKNHNADPTKVADAIKAQLDTRIDQAVSNGRLTADQATQAKQRVSTQVDQMMTRQVPQRPVGPPRGPRGLRRPGQPRQPGQPGQPQPQGTARTSSASAGTI